MNILSFPNRPALGDSTAMGYALRAGLEPTKAWFEAYLGASSVLALLVGFEFSCRTIFEH